MTSNLETMPTLSDDILDGADALAEFMFGDAKKRRKIYYLAETTSIPVFRLGSQICGRKSVILRWIADQEGAAAP